MSRVVVPVRRDVWQLSVEVAGAVRRLRVLVAVELWPAFLGWWVVQRRGRLVRRRWCWSGAVARRVYAEAVVDAECYVSHLDAAERRTVFPPVVCGA